MTVIISELSNALQSAGVDHHEANSASAAVFAAILQQQALSTLQPVPVSAPSGPAEVDPATYDTMSDADWDKLPLEQRGNVLFGTWPLNQPLKLTKKEPRFERKRKVLRAAGFNWNKDTFQWEPPSNN